MAICEDKNLNIFHLLRIARNTTIQELTEKLSISRAYVCLIENGERLPSKRLLRDYARLFGVSTELLQNFDPQKQPEPKYENSMLYLLKEILKKKDV